MLEKISITGSITSRVIDDHLPLKTIIINGIGKGEWKHQLTELRDLISDGLSGAEKQKHKRDNLSSFYPCVYLKDFISLGSNDSCYATGVVQFDVDEVVSDETLLKVKALPSLLYQFTSPSGGLKFGILTDFECDDIEVIREYFGYAYDIVKEHVQRETGLQLDDSVRSISQGCYVSYDEDAFYNDNCSIFEVNDQVEIKAAERENERNQQVIHQRSVTTEAKDEDVLAALAFIPKELKYAERLRINFAVLSHLGERGVVELRNHWSKPEKKELESQLREQLKAIRSGNRSGGITIGTLFHMAKQNGYEVPNKGQGNSKKIEVVEGAVPTYNSKIYSAKEATEKVENLFDEFFTNRKDVGVLVEAGLGKTEAIINKIIDHLVRSPSTKIAYFTPTIVLGEEIKGRVIDGIRKRREMMREQSSKRGKLKQLEGYEYPLNVRIEHVRGREKTCTHPLKVQIDELEKKADKTGEEERILDDLKSFHITAGICENCEIGRGNRCEYIKQFDELTNLRIYSSNHLVGTKARFDYGYFDDGVLVHPITSSDDEHKAWKADLVIIDEDVVSLMVPDAEKVKPLDDEVPKVIKDVFVEARKEGSSMIDAVMMYTDELLAEKKRQRKASEEFKAQCSPIVGNESLADLAGKMREKRRGPRGYRLIDRLCSMIKMEKAARTLDLDGGEVRVVDDGIWIDGSKFKSNGIHRLNRRFDDAPILYLDASGEETVIQKVLGREEMEFHHIRVEYDENVSVKQVYNKEFSMSQVNGSTTGEDDVTKRQLEDIIKQRKGPIISYMKFIETLDRSDCGWFNNIRGIDKFSVETSLTVIGRHSLSPLALEGKARGVFSGARIITSADPDEIQETGTKLSKRVFRMRDGKHAEIEQREYIDERLQVVDEHFSTAETYQALHRLRLIHPRKDGAKKDLLFVSNRVVDITVDELVSIQSLSRNRPERDKKINQIADAINEVGFVKYVSRALSAVASLSDTKVRELLRGDDKADFEEQLLEKYGIRKSVYRGKRKGGTVAVLIAEDCSEEQIENYFRTVLKIKKIVRID